MLFKPLIAFIIYIIFTLLLNLLGPWEYLHFQYLETILFLAVFLILVTLGYFYGISTTVHVSTRILNKKKIFKYLFVLAIFVVLIKLLIIIQNIYYGNYFSNRMAIIDIGTTYKNANLVIADFHSQDTNLLVQIETIIGLGTQAVIIIGFYYFKELSRILKFLIAFLVVLILVKTLIFRGTQVGIGNIFIYWLSVKAVHSINLKTRIVNTKFVIISLCVVGAFLFIQTARMSAYGFDINSYSPTPLMKINQKHILFSVLGPYIGFSFSILIMYFSMGYYGLSLGLNESFVWTHGIGNSFALSGYAEQYLRMGSKLLYTYPFRVEEATGWPALMYWHTAFPWLASDLTFPGTLIFFCLMAYIYARAFKEALLYDNMLSLVMFANLNILWAFIPANNQLMQTRESAIAIGLLAIGWLLFHDRFNISHNI